MFVEESNQIFIVEDGRVVESFVKEAYYGSCPHPDCDEYGDTKYDIKKNENCKSCGTSMKVEFPKGSPKKKVEDDEKEDSSKTSGLMDGIDTEWEGQEVQEAPIPGQPRPQAPGQPGDEVAWRQQQYDSAGINPELSQSLVGRNPLVTDYKQVNQTADAMRAKGMPEEQVQQLLTQIFSSGSRVSHREKEGTIISIIPGLYGDTYGVKFDDGKVAEFLGEQLIPVESEKPVYLSSVDEIVSDHIEYETTPANTLDELENKTGMARSINLRAKNLILDRKISMNERIQLDNIITSTSADIRDFKEGTHLLQEVEASAYLARSPKYKMDTEFNGWGSLARTKGDEDISWVNDVDMVFDSLTDERLISLASDTVKDLDRDQLANEGFMQEVNYYATLDLPSDAVPRFASYLREAVALKLEEPLPTIEKQASVESFDHTNDADLYL